jgi:hypothetical protein
MKYVILLLTMTLSLSINSQNDCKVLMDQLAGSYEGKCKSGLAHGKGIAIGIDTYSGKFKKGYPEGRGTYTYANGDVYVGEFEKGRREGKGKYDYTLNGDKSLKEGFWEDDVYVGPKKIKPYKIVRSRSVDRNSFVKIDDGNEIKVEFLQNGRTNHTIEDLIIYGSSGDEQSISSYVSWKNVVFPFQGNIRYKTKNKIKTSTTDVLFEFEIIKPGKWKVTLYN